MNPKKIMFLDIDHTVFGRDEYDNDKRKVVFKKLPDFLSELTPRQERGASWLSA